MSLLSEMPKLRKLDVGYLLPSIDSRPSGIATPFLPHLQALLLSDTLSKCANFIEHLSFPDSTCVHLCFCGFDTTSTGTERDDELRLLNPVISRLLSSSGTNDRHVERLELGQRTGHRKWLEVTLWISGGPDSEPLVEDDCCRIMEREELPRFEVEISKYAGPSGADEMLQIILPSLRLEKLREVVITTDSDFLSSNTYARFFAGLPELRIFAMDNPGFHNFVETLSRTDIQPISSGTKFVPSNSGDPTIAFPALERISLRGSSFDPVSDSSLDRLIDACKIRKAHNTIIPTVEVINFTLPDEQLALCRAALGDNFCVW
ncbi:hypothetical protein MPER_10343 [Moniliophthora perniciosa FA553]|nr:hypothetical protein MPER_10343 [Moniliophthora perniciosa FA553]